MSKWHPPKKKIHPDSYIANHTHGSNALNEHVRYGIPKTSGTSDKQVQAVMHEQGFNMETSALVPSVLAAMVSTAWMWSWS